MNDLISLIRNVLNTINYIASVQQSISRDTVGKSVGTDNVAEVDNVIDSSYKHNIPKSIGNNQIPGRKCRIHIKD